MSQNLTLSGKFPAPPLAFHRGMDGRLSLFFIFCLSCMTNLLFAQENTDKEDLGNKEYIIVKDYKPVLAESVKISDSPEGDTSTVIAPVLTYTIHSSKSETSFETATIKAVKVKDEPLAKLYRSLIRLGIGNYTTYNGELYVNSLRSKKGTLGLALKHFSGSPGLKGAGDGDFSRNSAGLNGKYFLENAVFNGDVSYNRDVNRYYGFDSNDTIINKKDTKQRFNNFGFRIGLASNYLNQDHLDYAAQFGFSTISDLFDVTENDFLLHAKGGKQVDEYYVGLETSFDYFKKTDAKYQLLSLYSNQNRNIITATPSLAFNKDKAKLTVGVGLAMEKNLQTDFHFFPKVDLSIPVAEHILSIFAKVDGNVLKNNFKTLSDENPFITSSIIPLNTIEQLVLAGGLRGNFSSTISFVAMARYSKVKDLVLFVNDTTYFNKFNVIYDKAGILDLHAELSYRSGEKLTISFEFDQYNYKMDLQAKAWHLPANEMALSARYVLQDKILLNASVFARGSYYAGIPVNNGLRNEKVKGYIDGNLGVEYKYSKILSIYANLNNLGFSRYYRWYQYPSERFNILGGISYSF